MPIRISLRYKGGPGSGNKGHKGRPGFVGGSGEGTGTSTSTSTSTSTEDNPAPPTGTNKYASMGSFKEASTAFFEDVRNKTLPPGWKGGIDAMGGEARMDLPEGGHAVLKTRKEQWVTGKFVMGTQSQQRLKIGVWAATFRDAGASSRWNSEWLWKKDVKSMDRVAVDATWESNRKKFEKFMKNLWA